MRKIYLASPFFNDRERAYVDVVASILRTKGFDVFVPMEHQIDPDKKLLNVVWGKQVFKMDLNAILECDALVAIYYGMESDSGTAFEIGYAYSNAIPIVAIHAYDKYKVAANLMVSSAATANITWPEFMTYDFKRLPQVPYKGICK